MDRQVDGASIVEPAYFEGKADDSSLRTTYVADTSSERKISYPDEEGARSLDTCRRLERDDTQTLVTLSGQSDPGTLHRIGESGTGFANPSEHEDDQLTPSFQPRIFHHNAEWSHQNSLVMEKLVSNIQIDPHSESTESRGSVSAEPHQNPVSIELGDMDNFATPAEWEPTQRRRLLHEIKDLSEYGTVTGTSWRAGLLRVHQLDDFVAFFTGSESSPYAGGRFYVRFRMTKHYPFRAPICKMLTKVFHPNIDARGRICVDILYNGYSPSLTCEKLIISFSSILHSPNAEDPLVPEIAELYVRDRARYNEIARDYTQRYATSGPPTVTEEGNDHLWWKDVRIDQEERPGGRLLPAESMVPTRPAARAAHVDAMTALWQ